MKNGSVIISRFACRSIFKMVFGDSSSSSPNMRVIIPMISINIILIPFSSEFTLWKTGVLFLDVLPKNLTKNGEKE